MHTDLRYIALPDDERSSHRCLLDHLMKMMRKKTLDLVQGLSMEQLDFRFDQKANTIGILLRHIAALEKMAQLLVFENRRMNETELDHWYGSLPGELSLGVVEKFELPYYENVLQEVRSETLNMLSGIDDEYLFSEAMIKGIPPRDKVTNYYILFHALEDEISHQGQIKLIKRRFV